MAGILRTISVMLVLVSLMGCAGRQVVGYKEDLQGNGAVALYVGDVGDEGFRNGGVIMSAGYAPLRDGFMLATLKPGTYYISAIQYQVTDNVTKVLPVNLNVNVFAGKVSWVGAIQGGPDFNPDPRKRDYKGKLYFDADEEVLSGRLKRASPTLSKAFEGKVVKANAIAIKDEELGLLRKYFVNSGCSRTVAPGIYPEIAAGEAGAAGYCDRARDSFRMIKTGTHLGLTAVQKLSGTDVARPEYLSDHLGAIYKIKGDELERIPYAGQLIPSQFMQWGNGLFFQTGIGSAAFTFDNGKTWLTIGSEAEAQRYVPAKFFDAGNAVVFAVPNGMDYVQVKKKEAYLIDAKANVRKYIWPDDVMKEQRFWYVNGELLMMDYSVFGDALRVISEAAGKKEKRRLPAGDCRIAIQGEAGLWAFCSGSRKYFSSDSGRSWKEKEGQ